MIFKFAHREPSLIYKTMKSATVLKSVLLSEYPRAICTMSGSKRRLRSEIHSGNAVHSLLYASFKTVYVIVNKGNECPKK